MGILEVLGLKDLAAYEEMKKSQASAASGLSDMLLRTGRSGQVSTAPEVGIRVAEQEAFDKDRDDKRKAHLSDVYSKTEIAFNQRQMEAGFAAKQKNTGTPAYLEAVALARAELDTTSTRENLRRALSGAEGKEKLDDPATDLKVEAALTKLVERKAADALGQTYGARITQKATALFQTKLGHPPTADEMKELRELRPNEMNGYMQAALADLEETDQASTGRVGLAHYDSRHTKPGEADMLGRVGSAVSPDLKQKSVPSGNYSTAVTQTDSTGAVTTRNVAVPVYVGQAGSGALPVGIGTSPQNTRRERQTNNVSTVKSAEAGLFLIEDSMAQAWEQAFLDKKKQNVGTESVNLTYEFGGYRAPMTYEGGLGDTYSTAGVGLGQNNGSLTRFDKVKSRLDAVTLKKDNPGAKVIMKQDKERGGYDAYTMYSQLTAGTGMQSLKRNAGGAIQYDANNRAMTEAMDWDAAAKTHAAAVEQAMSARKTAATDGVAQSKVKLTSAENAQKASDAEFAACIKTKFGGQEQYPILGAVSGVVEAENRRADLGELQTEAIALAAQAALRVNGLAARLAPMTAADPRFGEAKARVDADKQKCDAQVAEIAKRIAAADKDVVDAKAALADAVTRSGKTMADPSIVDLLAKGRAKVKAADDLAEAEALVTAAENLLKKAEADEVKAKEDRAVIDAGGIDAFLAQKVTEAKAKAKADLEGAIASAPTPEAKAKAIADMLAQSEADRTERELQHGESRLAEFERSDAAIESAEAEEKNAEGRLDDAMTQLKRRQADGSPAETVAMAQLVVDAEREALDAATAQRKAVEAFERARKDAVWDRILDDEVEDARAESEALALAASVGAAQGAGKPEEHAARKDLADKLALLQPVLKATAAAGDETRKQLARISAQTAELARVKADLKELTDGAAALGVATPALAKKIAATQQIETKVQAALTAAESALALAQAERKKQEGLLDPAREAVDAAREKLKQVAPKQTV